MADTVLNIRKVPESLHREAKSQAYSMGMSLQAYVIAALRLAVARKLKP